MPPVAPGTYTVAKGRSAVPRRWNPHPARSRINGVRATFLRARSHHTTTLIKPSRNDHHLLHALAADELLHVRIGERDAFDGASVGRLRHADRAAQLAVHLHHELHLVLLERRGIGLRPGRAHDVVAEAELAPEVVRDVRRDRREQAQENGQPFLCCAPASQSGRSLQRVEDLHAGRGDGVELLALRCRRSPSSAPMNLIASSAFRHARCRFGALANRSR